MPKKKVSTPYRLAKKAFKDASEGEFLYCLFFSHGLMKVGISTREARIDEILSYGLLEPLLSDHVVVPCGTKSSSYAEAIALKSISVATKCRFIYSKEVFCSLDRDVVAAHFVAAVNLAEERAPRNSASMTASDWQSLAKETGMDKTLRFLAKERVFPLAWRNACDFVVSNECGSQQDFEYKLDGLHWAVLELVPDVIKENTSLIAMGASRELRKEILQAMAESRMARLAAA